MPAPKKLFITDLDGTALGGGYEPYQRFPDHFSDFLDRLSEQGWDWALNTTWEPVGQWELILRSKVRSRPKFLIAEYGRQLLQVCNDKPERVEPYCTNNDQRIEEYCQKSLLPLLHQLFQEYSPLHVFYHQHLVSAEFDRDFPLDTHPLIQAARESGAFWFGGKGKKLAIRPAFLTKGLPLPLLQEQFGYEAANIACAGDETTDMGMMQKGLSQIWLAPSNAAPLLKEHILSNQGAVGDQECAWGIIDAFNKWEANHIQQ